MIRSCFSAEDNARLEFVSVRDYRYNNTMWMTDVRNKALQALDCTDFDINIYGYFKDETSWYLKSFPNWQIEQIPPLKPVLNATDVRADFFENVLDPKWIMGLPVTVSQYLLEYSKTPTYKELAKEYAYYKKYKADTRFVGQPWDPTFLTADAVVIQSGHVLATLS